MNAIQNNNFPPGQYNHHATAVSPNRGRDFLYREAMAKQSETNISITTDEGDIVTISNYQEQAYSLAADRWNTPVRQGMNFTSSSMSIDSFSLSIQGDLNDEELADIENLLTDLTSIAGNFFSGNLSAAMDEAMNIGDMGSLSQLTASFSYTETWAAASQLTEYHPVPASGDYLGSLEDIFSALPEVVKEAHTDEMKYAEMLKAQWQQIKDLLEARETDIAPRPDLVDNLPESGQPVARQMMDRVQETMTKHPRLAPLGLPLAHEAIDNQTDNMQHPALFAQKNQLKENFLQEYNDWMYSI